MLSKQKRLDLYQGMVRIRRFEKAAARYFRTGSIPGFIHLYTGEEAVAVGVSAALGPDDYMTSTHRGHGHALAKGVPMSAVMAELWGKKGGSNLGRGGSMHIHSAAVGFLGTNGIVAAGIPLAAGAAFAAKYRKTGRIAVGFVGDGGTNHGAFLETLNLAAVYTLPVIIVVENNQYATCTPYSAITKVQDIAARGKAFGVHSETIDGNDVEQVCAAAQQAVDGARGDQGPTLLVCNTYRSVGHYEGEPVTGTYRTREEVDAWLAKDPIDTHRARLIEVLGEEILDELNAIEKAAEKEVVDAVAFSEQSPFCEPAEALHHVYEQDS